MKKGRYIAGFLLLFFTLIHLNLAGGSRAILFLKEGVVVLGGVEGRVPPRRFGQANCLVSTQCRQKISKPKNGKHSV
jgi:hypothetical protein